MNHKPSKKQMDKLMESSAFNACKSGDVEALDSLIDAGVSVDLTDGFMTLLGKSICANHHELVDLLIRRGANVNARSVNYSPAIFYAVGKKNLRIVKQLIAAGANVNVFDSVDPSNLSILEVAADYEGVDICVELMKNGADWLHATLERSSVLGRLFEIDDGSIFDWIISQKNGLTKTCRYGLTLALWSSQLGHVEQLKLAIEAGAFIDAQDSKWKQTALHWALQEDRADCVKYLLSAGADVSSTNYQDSTPIDVGIKRKNVKAVVRYLTCRGYSSLDDFNDPAGEKFIGMTLENVFENSPFALATLEDLRQPCRSKRAAEKIMGAFSKDIEPAASAAHHPSRLQRPNSLRL